MVPQEQEQKQEQQQQDSDTTQLIPWKYCNVYANNRSPERLFVFQGHSSTETHVFSFTALTTYLAKIHPLISFFSMMYSLQFQYSSINASTKR